MPKISKKELLIGAGVIGVGALAYFYLSQQGGAAAQPQASDAGSNLPAALYLPSGGGNDAATAASLSALPGNAIPTGTPTATGTGAIFPAVANSIGGALTTQGGSDTEPAGGSSLVTGPESAPPPAPIYPLVTDPTEAAEAQGLSALYDQLVQGLNNNATLLLNNVTDQLGQMGATGFTGSVSTVGGTTTFNYEANLPPQPVPVAAQPVQSAPANYSAPVSAATPASNTAGLAQSLINQAYKYFQRAGTGINANNTEGYLRNVIAFGAVPGANSSNAQSIIATAEQNPAFSALQNWFHTTAQNYASEQSGGG